jgi:hypothetical protein
VGSLRPVRFGFADWHERSDSHTRRPSASASDDTLPDTEHGSPSDECMLSLDDGWAAEHVAKALFIDAETVLDHRRPYQTSGVVGGERLNYAGSESALSQEQLAPGRELDCRLYATAKAVCDFVRRTFGVGYTRSSSSCKPRIRRPPRSAWCWTMFARITRPRSRPMCQATIAGSGWSTFQLMRRTST